jgi:hypothetical protein
VGGETSHSRADPQGSRRKGEGSLCVDQRAMTDGILGSSFAPPCGCGGGSVKNKAVWILANAFGAISPLMRHSFVDRKYSPSTGMDQSEWEIILE